MSSNNSSLAISTANGAPFKIYTEPWSAVSIVLTLLGMFGNANIVIATIRSKDLRNGCNYLIFINAAFDFYTEVGVLQQNAYIQLNELVMSNSVCYLRISHMIFSMNVGAFLIWTIGIDRLFAIQFPLRYLKWQSKMYLFLMVLPAIIYSVILTTIGFVSSSATELVPLCIPPTAYIGLASNLWLITGVIINLLVMATYGLVFLCLRKRARVTTVNQDVNEGSFDIVRRLTESLLVIMVIYIASWLLTMTALLITANIDISQSLAFHIGLYVGWSVSIGTGCNYYIYFWRSTNYAQIFRQQLCKKPVHSTNIVPRDAWRMDN